MEELCKRCLLYEAGERAAYTQVQAYLETVPPEELASPTVRNSRLSQCRHCDQLIAGMCRKCGCYVEGSRSTERQYLPPYRGQNVVMNADLNEFRSAFSMG